MGVLPTRFTGFRRSSPGPLRSGSLSNSHRSFRLTRPAKEKMLGKAFGSYMPITAKKELKSMAEQISHAAESGKKTFTDSHGHEHKISEEERYFAKEMREGGHTLTRKSEVKKFAEGFIETAREEDLNLRSGYNIGSQQEAAGKIVKVEEAGLAPEKPKYSAEDKRREFHQRTAAIRTRIGLPTGQSTGSRAPAPTIGEIKAVQPITPGTSNAPGPAKLTSAQRPAGLISVPITGGRRTETDEPANEPVAIAPANDPLTEENQSAAESIPPAKDVDLPDTSQVDRGLPF